MALSSWRQIIYVSALFRQTLPLGNPDLKFTLLIRLALDCTIVTCTGLIYPETLDKIIYQNYSNTISPTMSFCK